ncbi:hypothetical protein FGB62_292g013 [Gracilaria domingensis]|nr:hypothetical protein FGB62_292g013 [Gracilaria domingensis]
MLATAVLEMALDFSSGATSIWTTRTDTFRLSRQASSLTQLSQATPGYIVKMRGALQRVEGTCFSVAERWYSPVTFNLTNSAHSFASGRGARCFRNRSTQIKVNEALEESSFRAADLEKLNIWNQSELYVGRDSHSEEVTVPHQEVGDVRIGALEEYSFLAGNINQDDRIEGSERQLTGNSTHKNPWAHYTALYRTETGKKIECLAAVNWVRDEETEEWDRNFILQTCLVPIAENKAVLGLYNDDVTGTRGEQQIVMLAALKGVTFHDLHVMRAVPFLLGRNNRMHTIRELGILAVLCTRMITAINTDGLTDMDVELDDEFVTVPTWSTWGIVLLVVSVVVILSMKVVTDGLTRRLRVRWNLLTAKGIAKYWLWSEEKFEDIPDRKGRVVLVNKGMENDGWAVVGVKWEQSSGENHETAFGNLSA